MKNHLLSLSDTVALIAAGHPLSIAGPEALLAQLPRGAWIGGTTVYALTENGGARIDDRLFVTQFPEATGATIRHLPTEALDTLAQGYAPGGVAVIVDCLTDNRVRTVAEVRHAFSKHGGNMGTEGSVAFQFKHCGQIIYAPGTDEDKVMNAALEAGASPDGPPGPRPHYGEPYYGCFVRDLDGHKIEATFWDLDQVYELYIEPHEH